MRGHRHIAQFVLRDTNPTNASFTGKAHDVRGLDNLRIVVTAPNTSSPSGTFKLQGSEDVNKVIAAIAAGDLTGDSRGAQWFDVELPDGAWEPNGTFTDPAADTVSLTWDGSSALVLVLNLEKPYAFMRLVFTETGTGSATAYVNAHAGGR